MNHIGAISVHDAIQFSYLTRHCELGAHHNGQKLCSGVPPPSMCSSPNEALTKKMRRGQFVKLISLYKVTPSWE